MYVEGTGGAGVYIGNGVGGGPCISSQCNKCPEVLNHKQIAVCSLLYLYVFIYIYTDR